MNAELIYKTKQRELQRIAAAVLSAAILLVMLFSAWFIAAKIHHHCMDKDCPVCASIQACVQTINQLSDAMSKPQAPVILTVFTVVAAIMTVRQIFLSDTLISQKIRQNN